jgi:hypothetical protein
MSRITGNDAYGLMEAYSAVYQPRLELTEEQIWEEVEDWVNELMEEGHDLSGYTWEEMYEAYIEEARAEGVKPYKPQPLKPLPPAQPLSGEKGSGEGYGDISKFKQDTDANKFKPGVDVPKVKKFGRISKAMPLSISGHATKTISANTRTVGGDQGAPRSQKIAEKPKLSREIIRRPQAEEVDVYDIILSHLLDEGYASSVDAAEAIMVNMSEDWRDIIINEISAMHVQLAAQPKPPAEVRKAPAKKPSPADYAPAAGTAAAGGAAVGTMARGIRRKSKPGVSPVFK